MDWAEKAEWLSRIAIKKKQPIPSAILNKPELRSDLVPAWEAFDLLNTTRHFTVVAGSSKALVLSQPILLSEIHAYVKLLKPEIDIDKFIQYIKFLDTIYLEKVNKK
jgi:hypothetical protein